VPLFLGQPTYIDRQTKASAMQWSPSFQNPASSTFFAIGGRVDLARMLTAGVGGASNNTKNNYITILERTCHMRWTNATDAAINVTLYKCVPRRDLPTTVGPIEAWYDGLKQQSNSATDYSIYTGQTPYASHEFTRNYMMVSKPIHFKMVGGATQTYQWTSKKMKKVCWNTDTQYNFGNDLKYYIRGFSMIILLVACGTAAGAATSVVSLGTTNGVVPVQVEETYKYIVPPINVNLPIFANGDTQSNLAKVITCEMNPGVQGAVTNP